MAFVAAIAPILSAVGAGVGAIGSLAQGQYQGQVARNNSTIALQNADYSRASGLQQASITSMKGAAKEAGIKTAQAANGIDVNTGSAVDVQASQRMTDELDAETVLNNSELQAYGYTTQSTNFKAQAQQDETAGFYGAASGLLGAASSLGGKWGGPGPSAPSSARAGVGGYGGW